MPLCPGLEPKPSTDLPHIHQFSAFAIDRHQSGRLDSGPISRASPVQSTNATTRTNQHRVAIVDAAPSGGKRGVEHRAVVLLDSIARAFDLARPCLAAQVRNELVDLADPGRTERMPLRFKAARRVDRDAPAEGEFTALGGRTAAAEGHEPQALGLEDLAHGRPSFRRKSHARKIGSYDDVARKTAGLGRLREIRFGERAARDFPGPLPLCA